MRASNRNYAITVPLVAALAELGLRHVCLSPGSRSTPLALAFAESDQITTWVHHDERSSSFFALGLARSRREPVAVVTTSGTAAAECFPAVVEARYGRVPLLVMTADRPPELRDSGAPQTIDQTKLYGDAVKWSHTMATPEATAEQVRLAVATVSRAWALALDQPPGPVHLNLPFREPLVPAMVEAEVPADLPRVAPTVREAGALTPSEATLDHASDMLWGRRVLIVCGPQDQPGFAEAVTSLADIGRYPVVADVLSNVRTGPHDRRHVLAYGDALARAGFLEAEPPEVVLRFGGLPTSKALNAWLEASPELPQLVVDPGGWVDPGASARSVVRADPVLTAKELAKRVGARAPESWTQAWLEADVAARQALELVMRQERPMSEAAAALALAHSVPAGSTIWAASSLPVRHLDTFFPSGARPVRFLSNRGANGIDGFVSAAAGSATGGPVFALAGDLSLLYDLTALATVARYELALTLVVINNDGGGIFSLLPQADFPAHFELLFGTPHGLDLQKAAAAFGIPATAADSTEQLARIIGHAYEGPRLVEIRAQRSRLKPFMRAAVRAVERAVTARLPPAGREEVET